MAWTRPRAGLWRVLPAAPLAPRVAHTMIAAGDRVAVWGGFDVLGLPLTDGGLFDPQDGTWRRLPATDIDDGTVTRAVSAGRDLVIVSADVTHRFDVDGGAWTTLPAPPLAREDVLTDQVVGGGGHVVTVALARGAVGTTPTVAVLDVDAASWRRLPDPPVRFAPGDLVATDGARVMIATRAAQSRGALATLDLDRRPPRWARPPAPALLDDPTSVRILGAVEGDGLVVTAVGPPGGTSAAAVLDGTRWRDAPPPPLALSRQVDGLWTGRGLLVWNRLTASGAYLDVASRRWERLPPAPIAPGPPRPAVWTGSSVLTWGGFDPAGALYRRR
ncbi:MAG TPA: kelch repeat-containing protein [Euzebyales bacterium]